MEMTTDTINRLHELSLEAGKGKVIEVDGRHYAIDGHGDVRLIKPQNLADNTVEVTTLMGVVDLVKSLEERKSQNLYVQVKSPTRVAVFGHLDDYGRRESLVTAKAMTPDINYSRFLDQEQMNISLQSQFEETKDRELLLKVIGNLKEEAVRNASDDGVSQAVTIKSGVATVSDVKVPNPVGLAPYRTFNEVTQPTSNFVFRMREGMQSAIFEADGGAWELEAMSNVKDFLTKNLEDEIETGHVVVIA
ncbi:hypothetical protein [Latilactobacillus curvatus]|uniref:hypothetical protein n=1 Tax=Latilactobacillus curvatus TaxID=28038 RepID=UPI0024106C51|nr:hypothetical protein [Latilactobacillus curvatus]MDG2980901.1 hypothetical protein [Latilactobacillus curvatus]